MTNRNEVEVLANSILDFSRNKLLVNLRFMDVALSYHKRISCEGSFATDGEVLLYDPWFILRSYRSSPEETVRMYLHLILHCIFQHPFVGVSVDKRLWNLACDMAVECIINDFGLNGVFSLREREQNRIVAGIKKDLKILTAEKIYSLLKRIDYSDKVLEQWEAVFHSDDHTPWYAGTFQTSVSDKNEITDEKSDSVSDEKSDLTTDERSDLVPDERSDSGSENREGTYSNNSAGVLSKNKEFWEQVSNHIQMDMETFSKEKGYKAGEMMQNLRSVNREKYDYTSFLKQFAVLGETMKLNEDEFDYIYYTYGLEHYDEMPLIEPLEYKEVKRIKDFVIAIDTSGSVKGGEVQMFLQKTFNILMQEDSYFARVNIHIIQCDTEIQEDIVIRTRDEFKDYLKSMRIHGLGGTDFRPVFEYVDRLIREKTVRNLKGMIYFTDGYGTFPVTKPSFKTAFVFVQDGYDIPSVPPWAIKLVLQHEDIFEAGAEA